MTLPHSFTEYTRCLMGEELYQRLADGLACEPPVSIRLNAAKCHGVPAGGEAVAWCPGGYYLAERPRFTFDPLLHAGWYYVQEASSMFLHRVLSQHVTSASLVLDLCAAPGGKSTAVLGALPAGSVLVSNEPVRQRANILAENMAKWGRPEVMVTNSLPEDYARSGMAFDVILCDVPCSGEGMFRKDEAAICEWSPQNVEQCAALQRRIVGEAWQCLRPGGLMVYSTCTFNAHENEENIAWACAELGAELLPVDTDRQWGITGSLADCVQGPVFRFIPGVTRGEGLFMAALRKPGDAVAATHGPRRKLRQKAAPKADPRAREWIEQPDDYDFAVRGSDIIATPHRLTPLLAEADAALRVVSAGVTVGSMKGRDITPAHGLALSTALRREAFPRAELTYQQAVSYLRREPVALPEGTPRGFVLANYGGAPIGFEKNLGTRANNLYPQEWRIKSTHTPGDDERPRVIAAE